MSEGAINSIISDVAHIRGIPYRCLVRKGYRQHDVCRARNEAMSTVQDRVGLSYSEIGRIFGGRDASTVKSGITRHRREPRIEAVLDEAFRSARAKGGEKQ